MWFLGWKGPSGFSASSTADQVTHGIDGTSLTAIVTGFFSYYYLFVFLVHENLCLIFFQVFRIDEFVICDL